MDMVSVLERTFEMEVDDLPVCVEPPPLAPMVDHLVALVGRDGDATGPQGDGPLNDCAGWSMRPSSRR